MFVTLLVWQKLMRLGLNSVLSVRLLYSDTLMTCDYINIDTGNVSYARTSKFIHYCRQQILPVKLISSLLLET